MIIRAEIYVSRRQYAFWSPFTVTRNYIILFDSLLYIDNNNYYYYKIISYNIFYVFRDMYEHIKYIYIPIYVIYMYNVYIPL